MIRLTLQFPFYIHFPHRVPAQQWLLFTSPKLVSAAPHEKVEFVVFSYFKHWEEKQHWKEFICTKHVLRCDRNILVRKKSYDLLSVLFWLSFLELYKIGGTGVFYCLSAYTTSTLMCEITKVSKTSCRDMACSYWQRSSPVCFTQIVLLKPIKLFVWPRQARFGSLGR